MARLLQATITVKYQAALSMAYGAGLRVAEVSGRTGTPGVYFGNESPRTMILAEKK